MLVKVLLDSGKMRQALHVGQQLLPAYQLVYPPVWPATGLLLATLSTTCRTLGLTADCWAYGRDARHVMRVTHAGTEPLARLERGLRGMYDSARHALGYCFQIPSAPGVHRQQAK